MEIGYLNEVKAILKSLVLSSPDKITVEKLNREYRDIEGEFIPFRRLGFNNLEMFLRSIPDTLHVSGSGHSACVYFVANDKSMHIHNMIMQQKKPKSKGRSRSRPRNRSMMWGSQRHTPPMQSAGRNNNNFQAPNTPRRSPGQQFSPFHITNRNVTTKTVAVRDMPPNKCQVNSKADQQSSVFSPDLMQRLRHALPQPKGIDVNYSSDDNQKKYDLKKPMASNMKQNHPQDNQHKYEQEPKKSLESNMKQIHPQGETTPLKTTENPNSLEPSLKYQEHIKQLENLLSTTCHVTAPSSPVTKSVSFSPEIRTVTKDKSTENKSAEATLDVQGCKPKVRLSLDNEQLRNETNCMKINPINGDGTNGNEDEEVLRLLPEAKYESKLNKFKKLLDISDVKVVDMDEAVPEFAANNQVFRVDFPKYTVSYGRKIPPCKVPDSIDVGSCIGVFIAEIHNPFKFWFHIHKDEHELDTLMNHIERFYNDLAANELRIPIMCLNPGQICAARYNDMWHRAEIVAPPVDNKIKVSFLDYGTVCEVNIVEIKYLATCFAQLPVQALRGSLSHIKPRGLHWSHEATMHFLSSVAEIMLFAKITEIDRENLVFHMILCDTHGDDVLQINKDLVAKRYALYNADWQENKITKNKGRRIHHPREDYPTFAMIESGEYPSFSELVELGHRGIDYEMIHDRIIFNKCAILNFHDNVPEPIRQLPFFLQTSNPFRTDILLELTGIKASI